MFAPHVDFVHSVHICDRHSNSTGQGHINPTGKGHTTGGTTGGSAPNIPGNSIVVHKDYILDYTSILKNVILEQEHEDGILTYRYVYGLEKAHVVIYGIGNTGNSFQPFSANPAPDAALVTYVKNEFDEWELDSSEDFPLNNIMETYDYSPPGTYIPFSSGSNIGTNIVKLYYHHDRLGSTDFLTSNVDGKIMSYITRDDWGQPDVKKMVLNTATRELSDLVLERGDRFAVLLRKVGGDLDMHRLVAVALFCALLLVLASCNVSFQSEMPTSLRQNGMLMLSTANLEPLNSGYAKAGEASGDTAEMPWWIVQDYYELIYEFSDKLDELIIEWLIVHWDLLNDAKDIFWERDFNIWMDTDEEIFVESGQLELDYEARVLLARLYNECHVFEIAASNEERREIWGTVYEEHWDICFQLLGDKKMGYAIAYRSICESSDFDEVLIPIMGDGYVGSWSIVSWEFRPDPLPPRPGYADIEPGSWYVDDLWQLIDERLVFHYPDGTCRPHGKYTRAEFVDLLFRYSDADSPPYNKWNSTFSDFDDSGWYPHGIIWGEDNGIINGYTNGAFGCNDYVTREQIATMLYRYAAYMGISADIGIEKKLSDFSDAADISEWATPAMEWAVSTGLIQGRDYKIAPTEFATRAEAAVMLMRLRRIAGE